MRIKAKTDPFGEKYFLCLESGRVFRRIVGGAVMPGNGRAGFLAAVGEEKAEAEDFPGVHCLRVLGEARDHMGESFVEAGPVFGEMAEMQTRLRIDPWWMALGPYGRDLSEFNRDRGRKREPRLNVREASAFLDKGFEYLAGVIRQRILYQKTMFFGGAEVAECLGRLPADLAKERFEDHPEVTALYLAVAGLDLRRPRRASSSGRGAADRTAGY